MLKIKNLTLRNFMSIGNVSQCINFMNDELTLVIGENLDQGGNDTTNGVGKTSIINGLSYALFGQPVSNIKLGNLINLTNERGMYASVEFELDGNNYRIERGRKPNIFKFIVNNNELDIVEADEAQGDSRISQQEITKILGFTHQMFCQTVALNTYTTPFLSLKAQEQRELIEQLFGITKLSEKAEKLKELLKITKDRIKEEEITISSIIEANKRIEENIQGMELKCKIWERNHSEKIDEYHLALEQLLTVDIEKEIKNHKLRQENEAKKTHKKNLDKQIETLTESIEKTLANLERKKNQSIEIEKRTCPACKQNLHNENDHEVMTKRVAEEIEELENTITVDCEKLDALIQEESQIVIEIVETYHDSIDDAYNHKSSIESLAQLLEAELEKENPYIDNIAQLRSSGIQEVNYEMINDLTSMREHQEFLLKLLTNKDSFIRKKIIDQNLVYLNSRLAQYLERVGLPHLVKFLPDLDVEITEHGRELDFDNLSRGERTRLILSLSWAFRDVYESLNGKVNLMFVDELVDNGLDLSGVESSLAVLKKMARDNKRNVFLISHRAELLGRVDDILKVVKESGFTTFEQNAEV